MYLTKYTVRFAYIVPPPLCRWSTTSHKRPSEDSLPVSASSSPSEAEDGSPLRVDVDMGVNATPIRRNGF